MRRQWFFILTTLLASLGMAFLWAQEPITIPLPEKNIQKLLPDPNRSVVYALNQGDGENPGSLLVIRTTDGQIVDELPLNLRPTDMAMTSDGQFLYVIHSGSRTIMKIDLTDLHIVDEKGISTPQTYNTSLPLHIAVAQTDRLYYTDAAWGPQIYFFDFHAGTNMLVLDTGGNRFHGAGGIVLNRSGTCLYAWRQYGWSAGYLNSWVTRFQVEPDGSLTVLEESDSCLHRDPFDTPILLEAEERYVFAKQAIFVTTNVSLVVQTFPENIYAITPDGSVVFGRKGVFITQSGLLKTNFNRESTVQAVTPDAEALLRYYSSPSELALYSLEAILGAGWTTNQPPTAAFHYAPTNVTSATVITFDASDSTDDQGSESLQYRWDWDSDGKYDTPFLTDPVITHQYDLAGTKIVTLQVMDRYGLTAIVSHAINVTLPEEAESATFVIETPAADLEFHPTKAYAYVTSSDQKTLYVLNLTSGLVEHIFHFDWPPESIAISPNGQKMYVALLTAPHSPYNFGPYLSYIVEFDLTTHTKEREFEVPEDVGDMVVTDNGILVIAGGSGQWTDLSTYNATTGKKISAKPIYNGAKISLHPSQGAVYGIEPLCPADPERYSFDPVTGTLTNAWDSPYHGDYSMGRRVWCHPNGKEIIVQGGHVLTSSPIKSEDMHYIKTFAPGSISGLCFDIPHNTIFITCNQRLWLYDATDYQLKYSLPLTNEPPYLHTTENYLYLAWVEGEKTFFQRRHNFARPEPYIIAQPQSLSVAEKGIAKFTVTNIGAAPFFYQWYFNDSPIPGQTNNVLTISPVLSTHEGEYKVVVSNAFGVAVSQPAYLTVISKPKIVQQPQSITLPAGSTATFEVEVTGTPPFTFQWFFEGNPIEGATNATLTISNIQIEQAGAYTVKVSNQVGSTMSAPAILRVFSSPPVIVEQPKSFTVSASSNVCLTVRATGTEPMQYQWFFNGNPIIGQTSPELVLTNVQAEHAGEYYVVVSNSVGQAISETVTFTVLPCAPYFVVQPEGCTVPVGSTVSFYALAKGSEPITYQWIHNGTILVGATSPSLVLGNVQLTDAGDYALVASNIAGVTTSTVARLTVYKEATILSGLTHQVAVVGNTVRLSVEAEGTEPLTYEWWMNGKPLGVTNSVLVLTNIQPSQTGYYEVVVKNPYGEARSRCRVSVLGKPGRVVAWGDNSGDQCTVPENLYDVVAVDGGQFHTIALRRDGQVVVWGDNFLGQKDVPSTSLPIVAIAAGGYHNLAITADGRVIAWGWNGCGQCDVPETVHGHVIAVQAGEKHSLALLETGQVVAWGENAHGQSTPPQWLSSAKAIAAGGSHSLAITEDGEVVGWGSDAFGQISPPADATNIVAIAAGYAHSVALRADGKVIAWGDNSFGQCDVPEGLSNVVAIAAGGFHTYTQLADGRIIAWGDNSYGQLDVPSETVALQIASGHAHGLAIVLVPVLQWTLEEGLLKLEWEEPWILQSAPTVLGPFEDVPDARSPYTIDVLSSPMKFFRLRQ